MAAGVERHYWLIKSEPEEYGWQDLVREERASWDGVRNYAARNNLRAMARGDYALFYHSGGKREVVGVAMVIAEAYPDPTAGGRDFSAVDVSPVQPLSEAVSLKTVKSEPALREMVLAVSPRLSVQPVTAAQFSKVLSLGRTRLA